MGVGWRELANCKGKLDLMFPEQGDRVGSRAAKEVCQGCPVLQPCLEYAIRTHQQWGVWGGKTLKERRPLTRKREVA